jgi:hypothetical protein
VGYGHEHGQSRCSKDGMVRRFKACHLELDVLHTVVFLDPKGNWQSHLAYWCTQVPCDDAVEWRFAGDEHVGDVQPHL